MTETESRQDDGELIRLCLDGEREAFDALAARHYRGIYNMIIFGFGAAIMTGLGTRAEWAHQRLGLGRKASGPAPPAPFLP